MTSTNHWARDSIFYHIYPLGLCGAPPRNDFQAAALPRLEKLLGWLDHVRELGANAIYLGPVFESSAHGYDTADYFNVDRRLGTNETLARLSSAIHEKGMRLILDGVFNHVGRDFWAFREVREQGERSTRCDWFQGLRFGGRSPHGDPFTYQGWNGHYSLVKLNLGNPAVREHLFKAVALWMERFAVDGLRLDAADCVDIGFLKELASFCKSRNPGFWLVGEVIHGDYRKWANPEALDSVTNYECYKGLYSSHVDRNYFEIAYAFNRQFGEEGMYRSLPLYAFADNHDVNRVASNLKNPAHLYPLYSLLFTMPGVPSIYYGSEWGIAGKKGEASDEPLRPSLDLEEARWSGPHRELAGFIGRLAGIRRRSVALRRGDYLQLLVRHEQLAFARQTREECAVVAVNSADHPVSLDLTLPRRPENRLLDLLNEGDAFPINNGKIRLENVPACGSRILVMQ